MSLMYNYSLFSNFHMMVLWTASCFHGVHFEFYNNIWEWKIIEQGEKKLGRRETKGEEEEVEGESGKTGKQKVSVLEEYN